MSGGANPLARHGGLSYLHIPARDAAASAAFYERVLGWTIERRGDGFRFATPDGLLIGGFGSDEPGTGMKAWFYVDGIDAAIERVTANGGTIVEPLRGEGDIRVVELRDPAGNRLGLWQFA